MTENNYQLINRSFKNKMILRRVTEKCMKSGNLFFHHQVLFQFIFFV